MSAKKPAQLRVIEGNVGHRRIKPEPRPRSLLPTRPRYLKGDARTEWDRMAKKLFAMHILTEVDGTALAVYCEAYALWRRAQQELEAEPGDWRRAVAARESAKLVRALGSDFGLSPVSRSRISVPEAPSDDTLGGLLD